MRPDLDLLASLDPLERASVNLLLAELGFDWSLQGLTALVYRVPRQQLGLSDDAPRTPALKHAQRAFFAVVYRLLLGRDTGPRLPTLLLYSARTRCGLYSATRTARPAQRPGRHLRCSRVSSPRPWPRPLRAVPRAARTGRHA